MVFDRVGSKVSIQTGRNCGGRSLSGHIKKDPDRTLSGRSATFNLWEKRFFCRAELCTICLGKGTTLFSEQLMPDRAYSCCGWESDLKVLVTSDRAAVIKSLENFIQDASESQQPE